jgi:pimeloyl-ACP methyl ester carboxylesterase
MSALNAATVQTDGMALTEHQVERDGVMLHVTDRGGSGSPVVLLHGLAGSSREWDATATALAPHRVLSVDSRGHGRSTRRPNDVSREAHVADVVHVIETLVGAPVSLVGQSMGGHTALLVAAAHPDLVSRLVLLEAGVGGDGTERSRAAMRDYFDSWPRPFADLAHARTFLGESPLARAWRADLECGPDGFRPRFDTDILVTTIADVDVEARWTDWSRVDLPTLVVFARDGMFGEAARSEFVARGQRVVRVDLESGSHDAHLDAFRPWIAALIGFLSTEL